MNEELLEPVAKSEPLPQRRNFFAFFGVIAFVVFGAVVLGSLYLYQLNQPTIAALPIVVDVEEGQTVREIAEAIESAGVIKSAELLYLLLVTQFDPTEIKASRYVFDEPLTTYMVAQRLVEGDFDTDLQALTIFEGESRRKIAERLSGNFDWFEAEEFLTTTTELEGQLFPETYFIPTDFSTSDLVALLHETYKAEIKGLLEQTETTLSESEVIILASIVEREANTENSMRMVAGIFNNRLSIGMALQADASIEYVLESDINELRPGELAQNLREIDSPYNTYLYTGLPPTPIGNPGRLAISAVLDPIPSEYLYYITGTDGNFYYAETYAQHLQNIERHLR